MRSCSRSAAGLAANLVSYGLAVLLYARIRIAPESREKRSRTRGGLAEGLRYVVAQRALAVVVAGFAAVFAVVQAVFP